MKPILTHPLPLVWTPGRVRQFPLRIQKLVRLAGSDLDHLGSPC
jgi:hypothetical protein